jgi:hypothetical protein
MAEALLGNRIEEIRKAHKVAEAAHLHIPAKAFNLVIDGGTLVFNREMNIGGIDNDPRRQLIVTERMPISVSASLTKERMQTLIDKGVPVISALS